MNYGSSKTMNPADPRHELWDKERAERGFDDTETWNIDLTIAKFLAPRLERFKEIGAKCPVSLTMERWNGILQEIIDGLNIMIKSNASPMDQEDLEKYSRAWRLLQKWHWDLWW